MGQSAPCWRTCSCITRSTPVSIVYGATAYGLAYIGKPRPVWKREELATALGQSAAALVLVLSLIVVVAPALRAFPAVLMEDPFKPHTVVTRVVNIVNGPAGETTTSTTTQTEANEDLLTRALASGGLLLLRVALAVLAAFLAGAVLQRAVLGRFDIKIGGLELSAIERAAGASAEAVERLTKTLKRQEGQIKKVETELRGERRRSQELSRTTKEGFQALAAEMNKAAKPAPSVPAAGPAKSADKD